jgi:hypothetical protein
VTLENGQEVFFRGFTDHYIWFGSGWIIKRGGGRKSFHMPCRPTGLFSEFFNRYSPIINPVPGNSSAHAGGRPVIADLRGTI